VFQLVEVIDKVDGVLDGVGEGQGGLWAAWRRPDNWGRARAWAALGAPLLRTGVGVGQGS